MRRTLAILFALAALFATACNTGEAKISSDDSTSESDDDSNSDSTEKTAIVESLSDPNGMGITEASAECVADETLSDVSEPGVEALGDPMGSMGDLSSSDRDAVVAAMDDCIDFDEVRGPLVDTMTAELGIAELSEEETSCVGNGLEDEYGGVGHMLLAFEDENQVDFTLTLAGLFGGCLSAETVTGFVATSFGDQGMDPAEADCVANELVDELGGSRLFEMLASAGSSDDGSLPADLDSAINRAVPACASAAGVGSGIGQ